jgi:5-bromo-4-chloroindolyl phosphate hydrolysis protein
MRRVRAAVPCIYEKNQREVLSMYREGYAAIKRDLAEARERIKNLEKLLDREKAHTAQVYQKLNDLELQAAVTPPQ